MIKNVLNKLTMYLGLFLLFGILVFPEMRDVIGNFVGLLFNPLRTLLPLHIIIFILAAITGLYASIIQKYTMNWELARSVQEKMKTIQNEFRQAQLSNNTQKMKKIEAQRAEMMGDQMEMMKQQFKPMLYISVISLPLFFWVYIVISQDTTAAMVFPFWGKQNLTGELIGPIHFWLFWYFICSIPVSQMTRKALNIGGM